MKFEKFGRALSLAAFLSGSGEVRSHNSMEHMQTVAPRAELQEQLAPFLNLEDIKMAKIKAVGMTDYIRGVEHSERAFQEHHNHSVTCIDERIPGGKVRLAGSGILLEGGPEAAADMLIAAGVEEVTSHDGCGAAALAKKDGQAFSKEVARIMSEKTGKEIKHRHITASEMRPPETFYSKDQMPESPNYHPGQVVYYDFTGSFNPTQVSELPLGFMVSRRYVGEVVAAHDVELAVKIATGDHGFQKHHGTTEPIRIFVVATGEQELKQGKLEAQQALAAHGENVVIDGFVAPAEAQSN